MNEFLKKHSTLFTIIFFILLSLALYNKILFTDEVINAKDVLADHYPSRINWHNYNFNPFNFGLWANGRLLGTDGSNVFMVLHLPDLVFFTKMLPPAPSFAWQMVTFLCLGGIFMYMYCRLIGLSYYSSILAGLFFMLSSDLVTYMNAGHYTKIIMSCYIPLVLFFLEKGIQERKVYNFIITGLILGYVFFYKHEQILFYMCLLVGYYTIFRLYYIYKEETNKDTELVKKVFFYSVAMTIIFFAISSISLLPTLKWGTQTERSGGVAYDFAVTWSFPPEELLAYFFPKMFGLSSPNIFDPEKIKVFYWGRMPFTQTLNYMGLFPLFFSFMALIHNRNKYVKIFLTLMLIIFPLSMGGFTPIYPLVLKFIPGFNMFRVPRAILCLIPIPISVIAGFGSHWLFSDLDNNKKEKLNKTLYLMAIGWTIIAIMAILGWIFKDKMIEIFSMNVKWYEWALFRYSSYAQKYEYFYESVVSFILISAFILIWSFLRNFKEVPHIILKVLCILVFIWDAGVINDKFLSTVSVNNLKLDVRSNIPPGMNYIKEKEKDNNNNTYRVFPNIRQALGYNQANSWTSYFQIIGGYAGVKDKLYSIFMENVNYENRLLDILSVKYIGVDRGALPYENLSPGATLGRYNIGYIDDQVVILENPVRRERIHAVYNYVVVQPEEVFMTLKNPNFNPLATIVLEEDPEIKIPASMNFTKQPKIEKKEKYNLPHINDLKLDMPKSGFLVFSEAYYPGWAAYVDGVKTKIYKTDFAVQSIFVPEGSHHVELLYKPLPFIIGAWISGLTFIGVIIIIVLRKIGKFDI
ncbi:YfhO family protein [Candidatus Poribacteria bacterium]|nr:YfhO family protein [Candidatus Poribacteria bacterium]